MIFPRVRNQLRVRVRAEGVPLRFERRAFLLRIGETQLAGLEDAEGAILTFRLAQDGDDPAAPTVAAWEGLARAYAAKGDAPAAIRQLERVAERCVAVADRRGAARANFEIGELWENELKRPESAMMRYEKALHRGLREA